MKKKIIITIVLMTLLLTNIVVLGDYIIDNTGNNIPMDSRTYPDGKDLMVRDSDGNLYIVYNKLNGTLFDIWLSKSTDDGKTWDDSRIYMSYPYSYYVSSMVIDSEDNLHIGFRDVEVAGTCRNEYFYGKSTNGGDTWSFTELADLTDTEYIETEGVFLAVDEYDNIYYFYSHSDNLPSGTDTKVRKYNNEVGTWSPSVDFISDRYIAWFSPNVKDGYIYATYMKRHLNSYWSVQLRTFNCDTGVKGGEVDIYTFAEDEEDDDFDATSVSSCIMGNYVHIAYSRKNDTDQIICYKNYNINTGVVSDEEIIYSSSGDDNFDVTCSVNIGNTIHILWRGTNWQFDNKIFYKYGISGDWSSLNIACTGDNNMKAPAVIRSYYPDFCRLNSGFVGYYFNYTENNLTFFNSETYSWYIGGSGSGNSRNDLTCLGGGMNTVDWYDNNLYLEWNYNVPTSKTYYAFCLFMTRENGANLYNNFETEKYYYSGCINGESIGFPDEIIDIGSNIYEVWWEFWDGITTTNEVLNFELLSTKSNPNWQISLSQDDCDNDGDSRYFTHQNNEYFCNNIMNGQTVNDGEPSYLMCYDAGTIEQDDETPDFNKNSISVSNWIGESHPIYNIPYYCENISNVHINYIVETEYENSENVWLYVYHNGESTGTSQGYPKKVKGSGHYHGYIPNDDGHYNASLVIDGVRVDNASFYVYPFETALCNKTNYIQTSPNPNYDKEYYTVYYKYGENTVGVLCKFYKENYNTIYESAKIVNINSNSIGSFTEKESTSCKWVLFKKEGTVYYSVAEHYHTCIEKSNFVPYIQATRPICRTNQTLQLPEGVVGKIGSYPTSQRFIGEHSFSPSSVIIRINGNIAFSMVPNNFELYREEKQAGEKYVTLEVLLNGTYHILDYTNYSVLDSQNIQDDIDNDLSGGGIIPTLPAFLGYIVGFILTMFCLLAPLIVMKGLNAKQNPPPLLYAISGSFGVGISVMFTWFPFWIIPFILFIGIIFILITWVQKKGGGE